MAWSKEEVQAFFETGPDPLRWSRRRHEIAKAITRHAWDLEAVNTLFALLGCELQEDDPRNVDWRQKIAEGREMVALLDTLLTSELQNPAGVLTHRRFAVSLSQAWLLLEVQFRPDERSWLCDLRERLTREAERREIDLRGMGV